MNYLSRTAQLVDYIEFAKQKNVHVPARDPARAYGRSRKGTEDVEEIEGRDQGGREAGYIELVKIVM